MAYPVSGLIKIFPSTVSILSGQFALNSDAAPQPSRPVADLQTYFNARVTNLAVAPCLRRNTEIPALSGVYVPAGGDYELQFLTSSTGIQFYDGSYPSAVVATLDFLDADFPIGMTISNVKVYCSFQTFFGPSRDRSIDNIFFNYGGALVYTYTGTPGLVTGTVATPAANINPPTVISVWSFIQAMKSFGLKIPANVVVSALTNTPRAVISEVFLILTYNTQSFSVTTTTPNVLPGNIARVQNADGNFDIFDPDEFKIYWDTLEDEEDVNPLFPGWTGGIRIPRNFFITFSKILFEFIMPEGVYGGRRLMLTGTALPGTLFTGEFPLQNFNVQLVDGSGLYTLVDDKRNDTYYDRGTTPVTTVDLKIPDPSAKTGFFHS